MIKTKRFLLLAVVALLSAMLLAACGDSDSDRVNQVMEKKLY